VTEDALLIILTSEVESPLSQLQIPPGMRQHRARLCRRAMVTRRDVLIGLGAEAAACGFASRAALAPATKRLGILGLGNPDDPEDVAFQRVFLESLASKGWAEGKNLSVIRAYSGSEHTTERLTKLAQELIRDRVDVILTGGHVTTIAAARATSSVPIVFSIGMPLAIEQGLIESYARPGRNVTGPALGDGSASGKRLQYLKQLAPSATRLAVISPPGILGPVERLSGGRIDTVTLMRNIAQAAGFEMRTFESSAKAQIATVFEDIERWRAHAIVSPTTDVPYAREIADTAFRLKLPSAFAIREPVAAGGLLSYGPQHVGDARLAVHAASYVDRIFRGADPATLPVELATRYDLVVNARTAATLRLTIPAALRVSGEIVD
jgi:putative ABC transport system substrate-binding protein